MSSSNVEELAVTESQFQRRDSATIPCANDRALAHKTLLIVEDERFVREAAALALSNAGYRVLVATNASEGIRLFMENCETIDLLVTDMVLPGESGRVLAHRIAMQKPVPTLFMSGYANQMQAAEQAEPACPFLSKPFSSSSLLAKIRELLSGHPAERALTAR